MDRMHTMICESEQGLMVEILRADPFQSANTARPAPRPSFRGLRTFEVRSAAQILLTTVLASSPADAVRQTLAIAASHGVTMMGGLHAKVCK